MIFILIISCISYNQSKYEESFFRCIKEVKTDTVVKSYNGSIDSEAILQCREAAMYISREE